MGWLTFLVGDIEGIFYLVLMFYSFFVLRLVNIDLGLRLALFLNNMEICSRLNVYL